MYTKIQISIFLNLFIYYSVESNNIKPKLERTNIVNKGLWVRNKNEINPGDFIFRANSLDADSLLQNNFDAFGDNNMQSSPYFTSYIERSKRSLEPKSEPLQKLSNNIEDKNSIVTSKLLSTLKPASVFNEYPFEVAALINDNEKNTINTRQDSKEFVKNIENINDIILKSPISNQIFDRNDKNDVKTLNKDTIKIKITNIPTSTEFLNTVINNSVVPKRSTYEDNENNLVNKKDIIKLNTTGKAKKNVIDENIFDKEDMAWQKSAPISKADMYKILPKTKENIKNKPITERGLIKVLSMLTKTFKRIMKQHNDIKRIHNRLYNLNDDFVKNIEVLTNKFEDFNTKYSQMMKINNDIKLLESKIQDKEQNFIIKEKALSRNINEFENQQKKFLDQQRQFFNVQKLLLDQNERINIKQSLIAKTQSEISYRQNNFARILKKAKEIYSDSKYYNHNKLNKAFNKPKINNKESLEPEKEIHSTTQHPTTESVKINLFSIPTVIGRVQNQDKNLLNEKDLQSIDDLIYKYYFNNTFIDEIMKNKILSTFLAATDNSDSTNKIKRNQLKVNTTILLPVNNTKTATIKKVNKKHRNKRWIKSSKKTLHKKFKYTPLPSAATNAIDLGSTNPKSLNKYDLNNAENDPFTTMALNFCKEIGQDKNVQELNWCIEKALRRLNIVDFKMASFVSPIDRKNKVVKAQNIPESSSTVKPSTSDTAVTSAQKLESTLPGSAATSSSPTMFFPDNEELEGKLREYEIKPDTEGNVYYEGSFHSSDIERLAKPDSEGFSDIMPGLDSDSRIQLDPLTFDLQAQRRADVRKINAQIMRLRLG